MKRIMNCRFKRPGAAIRLFCFPWAGGGASYFTSWGERVSEDIEVYGLCLPGREYRIREPCIEDGETAVKWITGLIRDEYFDKPFAFYGHSMGAFLAFLVAVELKKLYNREPEYMFLSGTIAPHSPMRLDDSWYRESMTKEEFLEKIASYGGTPSEVLSNTELMDLFYPVLRNDFRMLRTVKYEQGPEDKPPLSCPIDFFDGEEDPTDHDIPLWRQVTSSEFTFSTMPGGHFFLKTPENLRELIKCFDIKLGSYQDIM